MCVLAPYCGKLPPNLRSGVHRECLSESIHPATGEKKMSQLQVFSSSPVKASSMIGTDVVNPKGENLGEVKEVVIDPRSGKVAYAVVSFGGFLGMGEKLFAIPFASFKYNVEKNEYVLNVTKERLKAAPGFDADHWPEMKEEQWNRDVYKYYERSPYWE
jgi:sporulation protein YlmC with PRC-barrel domain